MALEDFIDLDLLVLDHAFKHGLTYQQIEHAWANAFDYRWVAVNGDNSVIAAVGTDQSNRLVELTVFIKPYVACVYHANTPLSNRTLRRFRFV